MDNLKLAQRPETLSAPASTNSVPAIYLEMYGNEPNVFAGETDRTLTGFVSANAAREIHAKPLGLANSGRMDESELIKAVSRGRGAAGGWA